MGLGHIPLIAGTAKAMGRQREEGRPVSFLLLCPDSVRRPSTAHVFSPDIVLFHPIGEVLLADLQLRRRFGEAAAVAAVGVLDEEDLVPSQHLMEGQASDVLGVHGVHRQPGEDVVGDIVAGEDGGVIVVEGGFDDVFSAPGRCRASYRPERYPVPRCCMP